MNLNGVSFPPRTVHSTWSPAWAQNFNSCPGFHGECNKIKGCVWHRLCKLTVTLQWLYRGSCGRLKTETLVFRIRLGVCYHEISCVLAERPGCFNMSSTLLLCPRAATLFGESINIQPKPLRLAHIRRLSAASQGNHCFIALCLIPSSVSFAPSLSVPFCASVSEEQQHLGSSNSSRSNLNSTLSSRQQHIIGIDDVNPRP